MPTLLRQSVWLRQFYVDADPVLSRLLHFFFHEQQSSCTVVREDFSQVGQHFIVVYAFLVRTVSFHLPRLSVCINSYVMQLAFLSLVLSFVGLTEAAMRIYSPNFLATKYEPVNFNYRISSFGKVPYGHTIMGNLRIPYPETGCGSNVRVDYDSSKKDPLILLVVRGDCPFLEKVQNAQNLKASLVVIVDNIEEDMNYLVPWTEDAPNIDIRIPSIVVEKQTGTDLLEDVKKLSAEQSNSNVVASVSFRINQQEKSVVYYKFDLNDRDLYETFFELMNFYQGLKAHIIMVPGFHIGPASMNRPPNLYCLNESLFCERREDDKRVTRAQEPLFESIRQLCLSRSDPEAWWTYVSRFYLYCQKKTDNNKTELVTELDECSKKVQKELPQEATRNLEQCVRGIQGERVNGDSKLHVYLMENYQLRLMITTPVRPAIMINGQIVYGRTTSLDILKEICASLSTKPEECLEIDRLQVNKRIIEMNKFSFGQALYYLFKLILVALVLTGAFYIIYKIKLRREMEKKLNSEVDSALANYYMQNRGMKTVIKEEVVATDEHTNDSMPSDNTLTHEEDD